MRSADAEGKGMKAMYTEAAPIRKLVQRSMSGDFSPIDIPAPTSRFAVVRAKHNMNPTLPVLTEGDWGDYRSDLDQESMHGHFAGKSNEQTPDAGRCGDWKRV